MFGENSDKKTPVNQLLTIVTKISVFDAAKAQDPTHCVKSVQIRSFYWSVFSRIRTEYGEIPRISPNSVQMQENKDHKKLCIWTILMQ